MLMFAAVNARAHIPATTPWWQK